VKGAAQQQPWEHWAPDPHTSPQVPQLLLSLEVSTHWPLQQVSPSAHAPQPVVLVVQVPLTQLPDAQTLPHDPQLLGLLEVFTHWPLQQVSPAPQPFPHDPQLLESLEVFTHWPLQQVSPAAQGGSQTLVHVPFTQLPDVQTWPHDPQFCESD
jgi:hypothetical protein